MSNKHEDETVKINPAEMLAAAADEGDEGTQPELELAELDPTAQLDGGTFSNLFGTAEAPSSMAEVLQALLGGGWRRDPPEVAALKREGQALIYDLRKRYNSDAEKIALLAQIVADTATRIATTGKTLAEISAFIAKRKPVIEDVRAEWQRDGSIPYTGQFWLSVELREKLEASQGSDLSDESLRLMVAEAGTAARKYLNTQLSNPSVVYVLAAQLEAELAMAKHFFTAHEGPEGASHLAEFLETIERARKIGREQAEAEFADCNDEHAEQIANGAAQA